MYPSSNDPAKINQLREFQLLNNAIKEEIIDLSQQPKNSTNSELMINNDVQELIELIQALHYLEQKQSSNNKNYDSN